MFTCSIVQVTPAAMRALHPTPSQMFLYRLAMDIAQSIPDCLVSFIDNSGAVDFNCHCENTELF